MKQLLLLLGLVISLNSSAQSSSKDSTIEQFCTLKIGYAGSGMLSINLDYGKEIKKGSINKTALKDEETGELKKFNSEADCLNYLGKLGWKLVTAVPVLTGTGISITDYIFKKEFRVTALQ